MSVLNSVLRDLAQRQGLQALPARVAAVEPPLARRTPWWLLTPVLVLGAAAWFWPQLRDLTAPAPAIGLAAPSSVPTPAAATAEPAEVVTLMEMVAPAKASAEPQTTTPAVAQADPSAQRRQIARHLQAARRHLDAGHTGSAKIELVAALGLEPGDPAARLLLARAWEMENRPQSAEVVLTRGLNARSEGEVAQRLATLQLERGAEREALQTLSDNLEAGRGQSDYLTLLATLEQRAGRMNDALAHYRAALALQPDAVKAQAGLGFALLAQGRQEEGRRYLQAALPYADQRLREAITQRLGTGATTGMPAS